MAEIIFIFARDEYFGIGKNNDIPWHCSEDWRRFKKLTKGFPVVMGRKTWDSLPKKPLPYRQNIVFTSSLSLIKGAEILRNKNDLKKYNNNEKIFIIGGVGIWQMFESEVDLIYETIIPGNYNCDIRYYPPTNQMKLTSEESFDDHIFRVWSKEDA